MNFKLMMTDQSVIFFSDIGYTCKKEGVYMICINVNNKDYAYIPEAQECMQPLHSHVNTH